MNEKVAARAKKSAARASATGAAAGNRRNETKSAESLPKQAPPISSESKKAIRANETWIARSRAP